MLITCMLMVWSGAYAYGLRKVAPFVAGMHAMLSPFWLLVAIANMNHVA